MFSVFLLALALAVDAFAVAFSYGLVIKTNRLTAALKLAAATGLGQFLMPVIGWFGTNSVHRYIEAFDHWLAFVVFLLLGLNVIRGAFSDDEKEPVEKKLSLKLLAIIGIATSIDACVAGISLYFMNVGIWSAAAIIGGVCFLCTLLGFYAGDILRRLPTKVLQLLAGSVLILLGVKVLYEHLS